MNDNVFLCRVCDGTGYVRDKAFYVFTFGIGPLIEWLDSNGDRSRDWRYQKCGQCRGHGVVRHKEVSG